MFLGTCPGGCGFPCSQGVLSPACSAHSHSSEAHRVAPVPGLLVPGLGISAGDTVEGGAAVAGHVEPVGLLPLLPVSPRPRPYPGVGSRPGRCEGPTLAEGKPLQPLLSTWTRDSPCWRGRGAPARTGQLGPEQPSRGSHVAAGRGPGGRGTGSWLSREQRGLPTQTTRIPVCWRMTQMPQVQELFHEAAQQGALAQPQPWWRSPLFVWEPVLFGTWDGVFTSCMINIFGVVLFLRTGWLVGNTGVLLGMFLVSFVILVALVTVLSGIGVGERSSIGSGGVYSMISSVLGGQTGGTIGLLYVFGQCVAGAMYITGFAESISDLLGLRSIWAVRGISVAVLLALLGINLAGVKWIIRLQLLLLFLLAVSTLDFVVGSFTHLDPENGFIGYSPELLQNNSLPDYSPRESFFTVFGVFFPAATGVMAGFNMGGDLREPAANIPLGSLAAVGISWFLYIVFVFLLGAICTREALRYDFLIAEKVSLVGFLFLLGLYISSLASCMGGLYGAPRILQCIAQEKVIPALACLGQGISDGLSAASWEGRESCWNKQTSRSEGTQPGGTYGEQPVSELCNQSEPSGEDFFLKSRLQEQDVWRRPTSFYSNMCNPWVSLLGAVGSLLIMFVIQWVYTLVNMGVAAIVYFYIGRASPGLHLGSASNFSFFRWMRSLLIPSCRSLQSPREQIILAPSLAKVDMEMTQLTQENADFATRDRYHHSFLMSREQLMPHY
ncbi:solute carrier family 12 member 8 isoform X3 [Sapajus apella]|uniref:Solute carrier family 12 member 8 n=1 Tax=Sapajus apella TaxID=9515 RepID=A0A6J3H2V9_SAPAP|nr:solute carrier family 12 member 8 isoform X3 [Sapajus apella]